MPFYPQDVEITGIELSPEMLAIGHKRAEKLGHPADPQLGDAQALEFADESFDTVTCTRGFCTIPDTRRAAAEGPPRPAPQGPTVDAGARPQLGAARPGPSAAARAAGQPLRSRPSAARAPGLPARRRFRDRRDQALEVGHHRATAGPQASLDTFPGVGRR
ncbi:MAG: class I SAM-dependent methyltransferase [Actinomycetota bacterium]